MTSAPESDNAAAISALGEAWLAADPGLAEAAAGDDLDVAVGRFLFRHELTGAQDRVWNLDALSGEPVAEELLSDPRWRYLIWKSLLLALLEARHEILALEVTFPRLAQHLETLDAELIAALSVMRPAPPTNEDARRLAQALWSVLGLVLLDAPRDYDKAFVPIEQYAATADLLAGQHFKRASLARRRSSRNVRVEQYASPAFQRDQARLNRWLDGENSWIRLYALRAAAIIVAGILATFIGFFIVFIGTIFVAGAFLELLDDEIPAPWAHDRLLRERAALATELEELDLTRSGRVPPERSYDIAIGALSAAPNGPKPEDR